MKLRKQSKSNLYFNANESDSLFLCICQMKEDEELVQEKTFVVE